jgi:hypothetical protein
MPAKRSPKKSRKPSPTPSVVDVTPVDLDALAVAPSTPPVVAPAEIPPAAPKAGPPVRGAAGFSGGRSQRVGQTRRYAFRRS